MPTLLRGNSLYTTLTREGGYTWGDADSAASEIGGQLVTINDAQEDEWLYANNLRGWIGLSDAQTEASWRWVSGQTSTYTNWGDGQPSNDGDQDYANNLQFRWRASRNDATRAPGGAPRQAVVEIPLTSSIRFSGDAYEGSSDPLTTIIRLTAGPRVDLLNNQRVWWPFSGDGITSSDFSSGSLTGDGRLDANGTLRLTHRLRADSDEETTENLEVRIYSDPAREREILHTSAQGASSGGRFVIRDQSARSAINLSSDRTTVQEGGTVAFNITTNNLGASRRLYWTLGGTNVTAADVVGGRTRGRVAVESSGTAEVSIGFLADAVNEGTETATLRLFDGSQEVGSTTVQVRDAADDFPAATQRAGVLLSRRQAVPRNSPVARVGTIERAGDHDWFRVFLRAGTTYEFGMNANTLNDPLLVLRNRAGEEVERNDDGGDAGNALLRYRPSRNRNFYLDASSALEGDVGSYNVTIVSTAAANPREVPASTSTGVMLEPGRTRRGRLESAGDHDWYRVDLRRGVRYQFRLEGSTLMDPYLELRNARGALRVADNDGGGNNNALINFTARRTGTFYLDASAFDPSLTGRYSIGVSELS